MSHTLQPIGARALHPVEVQIVARVTAQECHIRACSCGLLLAGRNDVDVYARFKEHLRAAMRELAE